MFAVMKAGSLRLVISVAGVSRGRPRVRPKTHWKQRIIPYEELGGVAWETDIWKILQEKFTPREFL